jgi:hypothetical protein
MPRQCIHPAAVDRAGASGLAIAQHFQSLGVTVDDEDLAFLCAGLDPAPTWPCPRPPEGWGSAAGRRVTFTGPKGISGGRSVLRRQIAQLLPKCAMPPPPRQGAGGDWLGNASRKLCLLSWPSLRRKSFQDQRSSHPPRPVASKPIPSWRLPAGGPCRRSSISCCRMPRAFICT